MRRSKEIIVLIALLAGTMAFVLWYVIDRKAKMRAEEARPAPALADQSAAKPAENATLGGPNNKKTIDFSSGQPVVKDSAEDKAALDAALKDMAAAADDVSFGPATKKKAEPAPATPPKS